MQHSLSRPNTHGVQPTSSRSHASFEHAVWRRVPQHEELRANKPNHLDWAVRVWRYLEESDALTKLLASCWPCRSRSCVGRDFLSFLALKTSHKCGKSHVICLGGQQIRPFPCSLARPTKVACFFWKASASASTASLAFGRLDFPAILAHCAGKTSCKWHANGMQIAPHKHIALGVR